MSDANAPRGLLRQLQGSLGTVIALVRVRLALLGTELELEKHRISVGLFWAALALLSLTVAAVLFCGFVILLLWDGYRLAAVGVLAVAFFGLGFVLLQAAQNKLRAKSHLFSVSLAELDRDQATFNPTPPHAP